jgi:hypothetical protein
MKKKLFTLAIITLSIGLYFYICTNQKTIAHERFFLFATVHEVPNLTSDLILKSLSQKFKNLKFNVIEKGNIFEIGVIPGIADNLMDKIGEHLHELTAKLIEPERN